MKTTAHQKESMLTSLICKDCLQEKTNTNTPKKYWAETRTGNLQNDLQEASR